MKTGIFTGLTGLDLIYYQDYAPLENKKSKTNHYMTFVGGPAANAAITYSILGGKACLVTCIGNSPMGKIIKDQLTNDYQIEVIDLAEDSDALPSISSIMVNASNASRTIWSGQQKFEPNNRKLDEKIKKADFCFSDCNLREVSQLVLKLAKTADKTIILDAGSWKEHIEYYFSVASDVIASNDCKAPDGTDFFDLVNKYGITNAAVTNGEKEIQWHTSMKMGTIQPYSVNAKDTLGAGDVFHGAYCYFKINEGLSFVNALEKAAAVATLSVQYYGTREGVKKYKERQII